MSFHYNGGTPAERSTRKGEWVHRSVLGKNKVYFIRHALDRMKQRGVFLEEVLNAIKDPAEFNLPTQPGRKRVRWYRSERTAIDVIYEEHSEFFRIVSVTSESVSSSSKGRVGGKKSKTKQRRPRGRGRRQ